MSSRKDLNRILGGLSLVAKEFAQRSDPLRAARDGDVPGLLRSVARTVVVSATDIAGLTRGTTRALPQENDAGVPGGKESEFNSVVYFDRASTTAAVEREREGGSWDGIENGMDAAEVDAFVSEGEGSSGRTARIEAGVGTRECQWRENVVEVGEAASASASAVVQPLPVKRRKPRERRVPSTPFARAFGFAGLGAGLAWGTLQESTRRLVYGAPKTQDNWSAPSPFLSDKNAERLALALCRMRGAALKIGQMLSIQDESLVPAPILAALDIVRQGADVMPRSQLNQVLDSELGTDWRSKLASFDYEPMAAASIGQVHRAVTKDDLQVAMKIQYPGVADSIESDIENVKLLMDYTNLIPEGLFLDRAMKVAKEELSRECDYELEAMNQKRFRDLLSGQDGFYIPLVLDDISRKRVLTSELVSGVPIDKVALLDEKTRNYVGRKLLELTLMELFVFRFMQTDPNWSNFLYDEERKTINLIDFGAARDYPKRFVDDYLRMVVACASKDKDAIIEMSQRLGFLTGMESDVMLDAHVQAGFIVGLPFAEPGGFDFRKKNIPRSVSNLGATMLRHRLTPPPDEVYSLHRKLSGAFLACIKLGAVVPCQEMLLRIYKQYRFDDEDNSRSLSKGSSF